MFLFSSINKTTEQITDQIWFYDIGLGDRDWTDDRKWDIRTLNTIKKDLKHTDVGIPFIVYAHAHRLS